MGLLPEVADVPVLATVLHLFVSEATPLWVFWLSFWNLLMTSVAYLSLWYSDGRENLEGLGMSTMGEYMFCLQDDIMYATFSFDPGFKGQCAEFRGFNVLGFANVGCLLLCVAVAAVSTAAVLQLHGADICTGRYLACKWDFERTPFYKCVSGLILVYIVGCGLVIGVYITGVTLEAKLLPKLLLAFLFYGAIPCFAVAASASSLMSTSLPKFDYETEDFKSIRFRRTWRHVFCCSSSQFARELEKAVLLAHCGHWHELQARLEDPGSAGEVLKICELRPLRDDEDDDESVELLLEEEQ